MSYASKTDCNNHNKQLFYKLMMDLRAIDMQNISPESVHFQLLKPCHDENVDLSGYVLVSCNE